MGSPGRGQVTERKCPVQLAASALARAKDSGGLDHGAGLDGGENRQDPGGCLKRLGCEQLATATVSISVPPVTSYRLWGKGQPLWFCLPVLPVSASSLFSAPGPLSLTRGTQEVLPASSVPQPLPPPSRSIHSVRGPGTRVLTFSLELPNRSILFPPRGQTG